MSVSISPLNYGFLDIWAFTCNSTLQHCLFSFGFCCLILILIFFFFLLLVPVICHSDWDENWKCYFPYSKTEQKILLHAFVNLHNKIIIFYSKLLLITVFYHSHRKTILSYTFNLFLSLFKIIYRKYCELLNEHVRSSQRKKLWYFCLFYLQWCRKPYGLNNST